MYYLKSENVKAFPLAKPRLGSSVDITSRIFYEQNVSNIIRQIIEVAGFIISGKVDTRGIVTEKLCINIYGYYFEIAVGTSLVNNEVSNKVFAQIKIYTPQVEESGVQAPSEIDGQDESGEYTGLKFSGNLEPGCIGFQLLQKSGSNWGFVEDSFRKFKVEKLDIDWIDGLH